MSTPGALNLAQQHMRPQKVLMSQVGHAGTSATLHNITTLPKAGKYSFFSVLKIMKQVITSNYPPQLFVKFCLQWLIFQGQYH